MLHLYFLVRLSNKGQIFLQAQGIGKGEFCFFVWQLPSTFYRHVILQTHPVHFLPSPRVSHVSQEPWFLLLENGIRNHDLGVKYASLSYFYFLSNTGPNTQ